MNAMTSPVSPWSTKSWSEPGVSAAFMSLGAVLICKEYSEPYRDAFLKKGLTPYFLQVLETRLVNQDLLKQTIRDGPGTKYGAVIITSSRAANAWVACFKDALVEHSSPSASKLVDLGLLIRSLTRFYNSKMAEYSILRRWKGYRSRFEGV
jgi:hypothetical protein